MYFSSIPFQVFFVTLQIVCAFASYCSTKGEAVPGKCELFSIQEQQYRALSRYPLLLDEIVKKRVSFTGVMARKSVCSVVGQSESLLRCQNGRSIDSSEMVFRIGFPPLRRYSKFAGEKVNYTLCKSRSCFDSSPYLFDARGFEKGEEYDKAKIIIPFETKSYGVRKDKFIFWSKSELRSDLFQYTLGSRDPLPRLLSITSGLHLSLDLLEGGYCGTLNLYGFGDGLRRYTFREKTRKEESGKIGKSRVWRMKMNHSPQIEALLINRLVSAGYDIRNHRCLRQLS